MSDNRFNTSTEEQIQYNNLRGDAAMMPYWEAARVINSLYAVRHGYTFLAVNPESHFGPKLDRQVHSNPAPEQP